MQRLEVSGAVRPIYGSLGVKRLIINTDVSLLYELKKIGKVLTSKSVGTGPSSYEKRIYRAAVSQRLRNTGLELCPQTRCSVHCNNFFFGGGVL